jgi:hypothetical protein
MSFQLALYLQTSYPHLISLEIKELGKDRKDVSFDCENHVSFLRLE